MKIIKHGKKKMEITFHCTCKNCGCVFEYNPQACLKMVEEKGDGIKTRYNIIICPECHRATYKITL